MTFDEFGEWMKDTQQAFPDLRAWMHSQADKGKGLWKPWRQSMEGLSLSAAAAAVEKMLGNVGLQPKYGKWDQLPGIVIGLCAGSSARPKGAKDCICHGEGIVTVGVKYQAKTFDGNPMRVIQIDGVDHCGPLGVACLCAVGEWVNDCRSKKYDSTTGPKMLPVYDPKRMTIWQGTDLIFAPAIEERDRKMMAQSMLDFDGVAIDSGMLDSF